MATIAADQVQPRNVAGKTFLWRIIHQEIYASQGKGGRPGFARAAGMFADAGGKVTSITRPCAFALF